MYDLGILNGEIYVKGKYINSNIYVSDGIMKKISNQFLDCKKVYNASSLKVIPGLIDPHVHMELDTGKYKSCDTFYTGSVCAAFGGITTIIDFLDPIDHVDYLASAYSKRSNLSKKSVINTYFHATVCNPVNQVYEIAKKTKALGMKSIKLFTTYSDSNRRTYDNEIKELIKMSKEEDLMILSHTENDDMIIAMGRNKFNKLSELRNFEAEKSEALKLASYVKELNGRLYMVHLSSGLTLQSLIKDYGKVINSDFLIESCSHYFSFDNTIINSEKGYLYTMVPPLRDKKEVELLKNLFSNIDTLATDHCPFLESEKNNEYLADIPMGIGSIESSFLIMYSLFKEKVIDKMSINPAKIFGLYPKKGVIREGSDADITIFDDKKSYLLTENHSKCDYSIYKNKKVLGKILCTIVNGNFIIKDGIYQGEGRGVKMIALINVKIYDYNKYIENGYIIFDEKIRSTGEMKKFTEGDYKVIDGKGQLVLPNFTVAHTHIYSVLSRGLNLPFYPESFTEILKDFWWKIDKQLEGDEIYYSGIVAGIEYIKNGVTTIIDHHASGKTIKGSLNHLKKAICDDIGMRGMFCFESSDRFDLDECIHENMDFYNTYQNHHCRGLFGLHASLTLSEVSIRKISDYIGNIPIHLHVAESEIDQVDSLEKSGQRVIKRLDSHGLLNENSILSHCVHIDEDEGKLIAKKGCYIALNASSNMNNGVGLPDYAMFKKLGIKCLIGNDGMFLGIANEYQNLFYAMRHKYRTPNKFHITDISSLIRNNYLYINKMMGTNLGYIKRGYDADIMMIPYTPPTDMNSNNVMAHLFYGVFNSFKPRYVWCGGKLLVDDYKVSEKLQSNYEKALNVSKRLWQKIKKEGKLNES